MTMECKAARPLIPGYLDGELSEVQATLLRQHLLACPACRATVQEAKALSAWFVAEPAPEVPAGFAARVARRALAGDRGSGTLSEGAPAGLAGERRVLDFVLHLTAAAALILFGFSLAVQRQGRPAGSDLQAQSGSLGEALEGLDDLNAAEPEPEARADEAPEAPEAAETHQAPETRSRR